MYDGAMIDGAMFDGAMIVAVGATFLLAGAVKGVIGLGLPTICLAVLTLLIDMPTAMALLLVPSFVTNLWQASVGGHGAGLLRRLWPFLGAAFLAVWLGAGALGRIEPAYLLALLGLLLTAYGAVGLAGPHLAISRCRETWLGPILGVANGVLTGLTGSFVVPGVMFLQSIGLNRDQLVQAMGILFTASTLALALALQGRGLLTPGQAQMSAAALLPALLGMALGQRIRHGLSKQLFRRLFFIALFLLGLYLIANAATVLTAK